MKRLFYPNDEGKLVQSMTDNEFIDRARAEYGEEGRIEIDDGAKISRGSEYGAYVAAWVWVSDGVPSDGSAPNGEVGLTQKQVNRIEKLKGEHIIPAPKRKK